MQSGGAGDEPITDINVTPLVDVSLVLVIIFMVTTPMIVQPKLTVTLPKAATDESKNEENVVITIDKDKKVAVGEKTVMDLSELDGETKVRLRAAKDKVIIIKADENVDHGTVLDVMDAVKDAKAKKTYFATEQKK